MLAFTWNTHEIRFCNTDSGIGCVTPDFWPSVAKYILESGPVLVSFGFQDSGRIDLSIQMKELGYSLIGTGLSGKCCVTIYSRASGFNMIQREATNNGVTLIIRLPNKQRWGVTNLCLQGNHSFDQALRELVYSPPMDYATILGSFSLEPNMCPSDMDLLKPNLCNREKDPFTPNLDYFLLEEGVRNGGPMFAPTCYLSTNRVNKSEAPLLRLYGDPNEFPLPSRHEVSIEDYQPGKAAWCDRIFYATFQKAFGVKLICTEYDRIDNPESSIRLSDHAIVYGLFTFDYEQK